MGKNIFVIIISYNFERWIDKCLPSLEKSTIPLSIILIDNNSSDNTVKRIKKEYPIIVLFQQLENLGFAKANNIGIKYALENNADYVFLLNQDAWIEPDTVEKLVNNAEKHPEYGILSPIHLTGSKQHFDEGFRNYFKCIKSSFINEDLYFSKTAIYDVDFVNAAAWLLPRTTLENIGGLGNQLFQYAAYAKIREKFDDCWFDISEYDPPRNKGYREFLLEFFNTIDLNLIAFTDNKRKLLLDKVFKTYFFNKKVLLLPSTEKEKYFFINHIQARELASDFSELKDNTYLEGYFANTRFFPNDFFSSFYFKNTYLERIKNPLLEKIKQTNSVSVHIRRGDYLNEPQYHNICTHEYYDKAINEIKNYTDKSYFFIQKDKSYISPTVDDLFFMSSCKHNILANSTYSWWGAYLNKNPKKIIIRPKYFANTSADDSIYPKEWKKI